MAELFAKMWCLVLKSIEKSFSFMYNEANLRQTKEKILYKIHIYVNEEDNDGYELLSWLYAIFTGDGKVLFLWFFPCGIYSSQNCAADRKHSRAVHDWRNDWQ